MKRIKKIASVCFIAVILLSSSIAHSVPGRINYQGYVEVDGTPHQGLALFRFAMVDETGSVMYWSNDGNNPPVNTIPLSVDHGVFNIVLGHTNGMMPVPGSVFENEDVYLRVWFDDGTHGSQQLSPDSQFTSTGFSFKAADADTLEGYSADDLDQSGDLDLHVADVSAHHEKTTLFSELVDTASDAQIPDDISLDNGRLYAPSGTGSVGIGTGSPQGLFHVEGGVNSTGDGADIILSAQGTSSIGASGGSIYLHPGESISDHHGGVDYRIG